MDNEKVIVFAIGLFFFLFFSGCTNQTTTTLPEYTKNAIEAKPVNQNQQNQQTQKEINNQDIKNLSYIQTEPKMNETQNKSNILKSEEIEPITNDSEYLEKEKTTENLQIEQINREINVSLSPDSTNGRKSSPFCDIKVSPLIVTKWEEATISVYGNSYDQNLYFNCGEEKRFAGKGGIFRRDSICQFNKTGIIKQSVWLEDQECAYTYLCVLEPSKKNKKICTIFEENEILTDFSSNYYARVFIANFDKEDEITVNCLNKSVSYKVLDFLPTLKNGFFYLSCENMPIESDKDKVWIKIGENICEKDNFINK
ncbi:MAG: hypothetical protein ACK4J0_01785 [Candidatus Anstonellaceae archaeon]